MGKHGSGGSDFIAWLLWRLAFLGATGILIYWFCTATALGITIFTFIKLHSR